MVIKDARFLTSVAGSSKLQDYGLPEYAFVGRSNVGKSSLINYLCQRKSLAKTSSTPGRTRLINYFMVNDEVVMVDLPGYGFALADKKQQAEWKKLIGAYLEQSRQLSRVFVLVDIRHKPTDKDKQMLDYLYHYQIPFSVIATKADKLSASQCAQNISMIAGELKLGKDDIIAVSAAARKGGEAVWEIIENTKTMCSIA